MKTKIYMKLKETAIQKRPGYLPEIGNEMDAPEIEVDSLKKMLINVAATYLKAANPESNLSEELQKYLSIKTDSAPEGKYRKLIDALSELEEKNL